MTISLAFLAPGLVKAATEGRLPRGIGVTRLRDHRSNGRANMRCWGSLTLSKGLSKAAGSCRQERVSHLRDKGRKMAHSRQLPCLRDGSPPRKIAPVARNFTFLQERSKGAGLRGGPERTRTACQARSHGRTGL